MPRHFCEHGAFVQDVLYAGFAGAKIGNAVTIYNRQVNGTLNRGKKQLIDVSFDL